MKIFIKGENQDIKAEVELIRSGSDIILMGTLHPGEVNEIKRGLMKILPDGTISSCGYLTDMGFKLLCGHEVKKEK